MEDGNNVQDQNDFVKEIKMLFSDKSNVADAKWKIKIFKQGNKYITDFIMKFKALVIEG